VLLRSSGVRICRPRPGMAVSAVCWSPPMAVPYAPRPLAGADPPRRTEAARGPAGRSHWCDCPVLRSRAHLGTTWPPVDDRVLAVVGGPSLGRRVLRGLCHHRDRLCLHATAAHQTGTRGGRRPPLG